MPHVFSRFRNSGYMLFAVTVSAVFSLLYNIPYYVVILNGASIPAIMAATFMGFIQGLLLWYILALNRYVFAIFGFITFVLVAGFSYYMAAYRVKLSVGLIRVITVADPREVLGLFDVWAVVWCVLAGTIFLFFLYWRSTIKKDRWVKTFVSIMILILLTLAAKILEPASIRRHAPMPYVLYEHLYHYGLEAYRVNNFLKNKHKITDEFTFSLDHSDSDRIIVVMVGESMRGDHLHINGYDRPTSPSIEASGAFSFPDAVSCMTLTSHSITCMFTKATESTWEESLRQTTFISVFRKLGFSTHWISNQGRLGHDTWVGSVAEESQSIFFCDDHEKVGEPSLDACMLPAIEEALSEQGKDKLIVLHMYGSHMRYDDRYSKEFEIFTPVCDRSKAFAECEGEALINAYDNSILYSDHFYGEVIKRLRDKNAILFFVSDHGEPLGENGIRARGDNTVRESRTIPFIVWMSDAFRADHPALAAIVSANRGKAVSHNNLIHSVLGCTGVRSDFIDNSLNICNLSLVPHVDPFLP